MWHCTYKAWQLRCTMWCWRCQVCWGQMLAILCNRIFFRQKLLLLLSCCFPQKKSKWTALQCCWKRCEEGWFIRWLYQHQWAALRYSLVRRVCGWGWFEGLCCTSRLKLLGVPGQSGDRRESLTKIECICMGVQHKR